MLRVLHCSIFSFAKSSILVLHISHTSRHSSDQLPNKNGIAPPKDHCTSNPWCELTSVKMGLSLDPRSAVGIRLAYLFFNSDWKQEFLHASTKIARYTANPIKRILRPARTYLVRCQTKQDERILRRKSEQTRQERTGWARANRLGKSEQTWQERTD